MAGSAWARSTPPPATPSPIRSGTRHHIPHGLACALIFPHTLAFNAPAAAGQDRAGAGGSGPAPSRPSQPTVRDAALRFCAGLGIDMRLSAHGVPEADLDAMATEAHAIRRLLDNNPRDISQRRDRWRCTADAF